MELSEHDLRDLFARAARVAAIDDPGEFAAAGRAALREIVRTLERAGDGYAENGLTDRERELLGRAIRGETNHEIAVACVISPRTVAKHLEHAYAKLGVHGRREAARLLSDTRT
jgi:DNA-binding CsgD family transcriptional regulator